MQSNRNVFARDDTLLGVCEALGEDFGFNPFLLRAAIGVSMIWFPIQVIALYLAAGVVVMAARLVFPKPRKTAAAVEAAQPAPAALQGVNEAEALAVAA